MKHIGFVDKDGSGIEFYREDGPDVINVMITDDRGEVMFTTIAVVLIDSLMNWLHEQKQESPND